MHFARKNLGLIKRCGFLKFLNPSLDKVINASFATFSNGTRNSYNPPQLKRSRIRELDIGRNYFALINPRRKRYLITLLDSYTKNPNTKNGQDLEDALELFFKLRYKGKPLSEIKDQELDLSLGMIHHLYAFMIFDRLSSQITRKDYLDHQVLIDAFEKKPMDQRNKMKYVFTSHPTQPNSLDQLKNISLLLQGIEENDLDFVDYHMNQLISCTNKREFIKPSYLDESVTYHSLYLKNLIKAADIAYDLGFKSLSDYIEIPGTWMTFDFDNHPGMETGIMTYTNGLVINITVKEYEKLIEFAKNIDQNAFDELTKMLDEALAYGDHLQGISNDILSKKITKVAFFEKIQEFDLFKLEKKIAETIENLTQHRDEKVRTLSEKLKCLFKIFRLTGVLGQIRLAGEDLLDKTNISEIKPIIHDILKEISLLQANGQIVDMLIIANYTRGQQYKIVESLLENYNISKVEIVPLLETYSSQNESPSKITMIASSDTRQRDGLILTELRTLKEFDRNPHRYIYMGQGITPERGGGSYFLIHLKYHALTRAQRARHIRTVQGHYFTSEFSSRDLAFSFLLNGLTHINRGEHFVPTQEYLAFLEDLDNIVGIPQRKLQKTDDFNDLYVKNNLVKTLVHSFNFSGSRDLNKPLVKVKAQRAIVQAYINSDRCSFTHPELSFWERLNENNIAAMANFYHEDNPHLKYMLYMYILMIKRYDLEFAASEVGIDSNSEVFKEYQRGKIALERILNYIGLNQKSLPVCQLWKEHIGLQSSSTQQETVFREELLKGLVKFQNYQARKFVREQILHNVNMDDEIECLRKLRFLQCLLANITSFSGKG